MSCKNPCFRLPFPTWDFVEDHFLSHFRRAVHKEVGKPLPARLEAV